MHFNSLQSRINVTFDRLLRYKYTKINSIYHISLIENDAIINDQTGVATVLNDYYVNVTKSIGQPDLLDVNEDIEDVFLAHESHESVQYMKVYERSKW